MAEERTVTIRVSQGELRGRRRRTVWGTPYCSFQGIPYAAPPVGPLRFKPPQPAAAWSGVRDATKQGNKATQFDRSSGRVDGDEDCLFVNVYTPKLPSEGSGGLLPVMFMIHGGGLVVMSGNEEFLGPDFLLDHGVVFVSFNYRLGVLGFLSTGDNVVPGNMGFKDQVMALRWVRDNIASFGGDPDNVTILGCSAGGWSSHALVLSPLAKGLFRRAIAQSGVALGDGVCSDRMRARSFTLGAHLGLKTDGSRQLVDFLREQPASLLVKNTKLGCTEEDVARSLLFPFVGTVESPDAEGGAFFPREPAQLLRSGDFQKVPFIVGVCAHEASVFASAKPDVSSYAENHRLLIPTNLPCPDADKDAVAEEIRTFYFGDRDISPGTEKELWTLLADLMFTYHAVRVAKVHSLKSPVPTYFFVFDYLSEQVPKGPTAEMFRITKENFNGAGHATDFRYICYSKAAYDAPPRDSFEGKLTNQLTRLWTNFAKTGKLTDPEVDVAWPPFTVKDGDYLHTTSSGFSITKHPFKDRVAFWEKLYDRYDG